MSTFYQDDPTPPPIPPAQRSDNWLRYAAERAASIGLILFLATDAAIAKQRAYRTLLGATILSVNLAIVFALLARWRRPASGIWNLLICSAIILAAALQIALFSSLGIFAVSE